MVGLCLAVFPTGMDQTILATATPTISDDFHALDGVGWWTAIYLFTLSIFLLVYGKPYSLYSVKIVYLAAIAIFKIYSLMYSQSQLGWPNSRPRAFCSWCCWHFHWWYYGYYKGDPIVASGELLGHHVGGIWYRCDCWSLHWRSDHPADNLAVVFRNQTVPGICDNCGMRLQCIRKL
ncbi:hypothetical protein UA08_03839 [Talaromyces atroroseus]|uniref:Uncharacterized protein n=1 Tax=Talaromyces atroroseus TaxID=1441469 RepID=A0A225AVR6_TALAT|nr:hypothetical protein UA08_03839 [Talaromyces atroroseus]OKL61398.1 hypothetical protein UA08_03839 [Talaromyces atroroseus]